MVQMVDYFAVFARNLMEVLTGLLPSTLAMAAICTGLYFFSSHACNPGIPWWRNRGLATDAWYWLVIPFMAPFVRLVLLFSIAAFFLPFLTHQQLSDYINNGYGPLGSLGFWSQVLFYLVVSDFLLYWIHRVFHGKRLWPFHAIHHSAQDVDWTTSYRFHPINLMLGVFLIDVVMLYVGVSPKVLIFLAPFQTMTALFVHANLNWTFGPLKYVIATPVFHRWHHGPPHLGGNKNFAPALALRDYMFGTFYMPEGELPKEYGVDDPHMPHGFFSQLFYPFKAAPGGNAAALNAPQSAIGSAQSPRAP
jgi:sterol desaturase/sphingolipid hydroxylase (fatty acid hydroxylase superfamily)